MSNNRLDQVLLLCYWYHVFQYNLSHDTWRGDRHHQVTPLNQKHAMKRNYLIWLPDNLIDHAA